MSFCINLFKQRSSRLKELGFGSYADYLASEHWARRKVLFAAAHPAVCFYCQKTPTYLHHKSYARLGDELDSDLRWLCGTHHAEVHERGFIGRPTTAMTEILRERGYTDEDMARLTFGDAYSLIASDAHPVLSPLAYDPEVQAILLG